MHAHETTPQVKVENMGCFAELGRTSMDLRFQATWGIYLRVINTLEKLTQFVNTDDLLLIFTAPNWKCPFNYSEEILERISNPLLLS